jgi:adenylyl cyclase-associated protein
LQSRLVISGLGRRSKADTSCQSAAFCDAFRAQRNVLHISTLAKEPKQSEPVYMEILGDLQRGIEAVNNVRDNHRKVPEENHLAMLADGVGMLAWVTIKPNPSDYIGEIVGGAQFYGNKILKEHKEKSVVTSPYMFISNI